MCRTMLGEIYLPLALGNCLLGGDNAGANIIMDRFNVPIKAAVVTENRGNYKAQCESAT